MNSENPQWFDVPATLGTWKLTRHAREQIANRGFRLEDVAATCQLPEQRYTSYDYGPNRWVYQRGHVALAVDPSTRTVITVLLRSYGSWTDDDARRANGFAA